jgi:extradiol dioxygenase family protein
VTDLTCPRPLDLQTTLECHPIPHFGGVWSEEEWTSIDHQVETR